MSEPTIHIDDLGVRRELADGEVEQVAWDDLQEVSIVTTADGPFACQASTTRRPSVRCPASRTPGSSAGGGRDD